MTPEHRVLDTGQPHFWQQQCSGSYSMHYVSPPLTYVVLHVSQLGTNNAGKSGFKLTWLITPLHDAHSSPMVD